jgi:23S rRNA-/tRNA-specific pseudouridylate synthase
MAVSDPGKGREAWTGFRVLERFPHATFVEAALHTGRTHQIRVHFAHLGFPVIGDDTYGPRQNKRFTRETGIIASRQLLHASHITFQHPKTGKKIRCEAPLPKDFRVVMKALR